jgi:hypothetical protein
MLLSNNYFIRGLKLIALLFFALISFVSCDVNIDNDTQLPDNVAVRGTYSGLFGFGDEAPESSIKCKIKEGGVFQEIGIHSGSVVGQGTWEMNGDILTADYTTTFAPYNKYSMRLTFNINSGNLKGTWGGEFDDSDGGKIDLYKD